MRAKVSIRNRYLLIGDLIVIAAAVLATFVLRFELGQLFYQYLPFAYWMIAVGLLVKPLVYYFFGMYRRLWLYASVEELKLITAAVTTASALLALIMLLLYSTGVVWAYLRSVFVIDWLPSLILTGCTCFIFRISCAPRLNQLSSHAGRKRPVLIVGPSDAGA